MRERVILTVFTWVPNPRYFAINSAKSNPKTIPATASFSPTSLSCPDEKFSVCVSYWRLCHPSALRIQVSWCLVVKKFVQVKTWDIIHFSFTLIKYKNYAAKVTEVLIYDITILKRSCSYIVKKVPPKLQLFMWFQNM